MSKSSGRDDINLAYLEKLADAVADAAMSMQKISSSYGSSSQLEQTLKSLAQMVRNGDMTLKQMLREGAATQKNIRSVEYGLEDTTKYNKTVNMFLKILEERISGSKIDDVLVEKITTALENLDVTAILESEKIGQRGGKGAPLKNVMDNEKLGKVNEDLAKRIGLSLDSTADRLMTFFQEQEEKKQKKARGLVEDLIDGLEKSKWVGGALRDTFKLIGLIGANWLSQFGQLGRIIGAAFYVAMDAFGPVLVRLLFQGIGKLFLDVLPNMIGKFATGAASSALGAATGGAVAGGATALGTGAVLGTGATAGTVATGGAITGWGTAAGLVGGGATVGAATAGAATAGATTGAALGAGTVAGGTAAGGATAVAGGAAAGASMLTGVGEVVLAIAAIAALCAAIYALWKKFGSSIEIYFKEATESYKESSSFMNWLRNVLPTIPGINAGFEDSSNPNSSAAGAFGLATKGPAANLLEGKTDSTGHLDVKKMSAADWAQADTLKPEYDLATGAITNLGKMSQKRAAEVIRADILAKGDQSYYEIGDKDLVDINSFNTDAANKALGEAYFVRGTSARVRSELEKLQSLGYDTSGAKITAGIGTLGSSELMSPHVYHDSVSGHFGTTSSVDVGYIYKDGRRVDYSEYSRHLGKMAFGQSEGDHDHWAFGPFQWMKALQEDYENRKPLIAAQETTDKMMAISELVKALPEEDKKAFAEKLSGAKPKDNSDLLKIEEKILKDLGIYADKNTNSWMKATDQGAASFMQKDSTGTYGWYLLTNTMEGATKGATNGRWL